MVLTLIRKITPNSALVAEVSLALTAEERTRSRYQIEISDGQVISMQLPRGTVLRQGDWLQSTDDRIVWIVAKPEPVLTVQASQPLELLQAAYHLGNRHVPLEITSTYLRLSPDPVLQAMLEHRHLVVQAELQPFQPELGAYGHSHAAHSHAASSHAADFHTASSHAAHSHAIEIERGN